MPGELFVEYQPDAQQMRPDTTVCVAAYGNDGCRITPQVERVLVGAMKELLAR